MMALNYADHPLKVLYAKGQFLYEENGNKVLDCINNVSHIGHCHPYFVAQLNSQNQRLLTNSRFVYDELMSCTHKLLNRLPRELCNVTFVNSGSEANDLAMQMAAFHTNKQRTICFDGAYHGITGKCMEVSPYKWNKNYKKPDHITIAEVPCFYRGKFRDSENPVEDYVNYFKGIITEDTSTFICEYMQSCGGQIIPPKNFYQELYKYLRAKGVVCIGDEVQTGFARLGENYWAFEYYGVVPDILTIGKAMGNGCPVAAVICTKEIAESFKQRDMEFFSTFGGNPLAMAASSAVMDVIEWQKLQENARETGAYLKKRLVEEILPFKNVGDIRGVGLFQGIDIVKSKESREENGELAKKIIMRMRDKLVLISRDGPLHNVLKIKPPIVFNKENVDTLIEKLKETLEEIEQIE
jgi:ethanolamine-phosphate phospho-lyase